MLGRGRGWTGATARTSHAGLPSAPCGREVSHRGRLTSCIHCIGAHTECRPSDAWPGGTHHDPPVAVLGTIRPPVSVLGGGVCVCRCYCGCSAGNAAVLSDSSGGTGSLVSVDSTSTQASAICQVDWLCPTGHGCDVATQTKVRALAMHESRI